MSLRASTFTTLAALAVGIGFAGCAGAMNAASPLAPAAPYQQSSVVRTAVAPAPQSDVVVGDDSGMKIEKLNAAGGTLYLPAVSGFKGSIMYPSSNAPAGTTATLTDSTTNSFGTPAPPVGTAIYYLQVQVGGQNAITFDAGTVKGKIVSSQLLRSKTYSVYCYVAGQQALMIQAGSPKKDGIISFGATFGGGTLPGSITGVVQLVQN